MHGMHGLFVRREVRWGDQDVGDRVALRYSISLPEQKNISLAILRAMERNDVKVETVGAATTYPYCKFSSYEEGLRGSSEAGAMKSLPMRQY